jgi:site-specific DNA-methyltransferase (adenine-specific)
VAKKLYQIAKDGGVIVWVVNDATINGSETGTSFRQALYFKEIGFNLHDTMIYQKTGIPFPEQVRYYPCFEYMFVLSKGKPKTINLIQDKKNSGFGHLISGSERQADGSFKRQNGAIEKRRLKEFGVRTNVWVYKTGKGNSSKNPIAFEHPAIFPLNLAEDHILSWSNPNDIVLDCFSGSGTTAVACHNLKRRFICIEKDKDYWQASVERLKNAQAQLKLF